MKEKDFINYKAVSRWLSGNSSSIRSNNIANIYKEAVQELEENIKQWQIKYPEQALKQKEQPVSEAPAPKIEKHEVQEQHKKGEFKELKPRQPNITENEHCYKVVLWKAGEIIVGYEYDYYDAVKFRDSYRK